MAVVFDKDLTFRQRIAEHNKESLKVMAGKLGLRKISKLKKAELVERTAEEMELILGIADDMIAKTTSLAS